MHDSLTRALQFARKCLQSLAQYCGNIIDRIRWKAPVVHYAVRIRMLKIMDATATACRIVLAHTWRFLYRLYFTGDVICIRISEWLRCWTPIVMQAVFDFCLLCLARAWRFFYRLYFLADVVCIRIADWFRCWTPIVTQAVFDFYLLCLARTWRFLYRIYFIIDVVCIRIADWFRYWTPIVTQAVLDFYLLCLARTWRFLYRIYFITDVVCIRIADWFRYWTPIVTQAVTGFYLLCVARAWRFIYRVYFFTVVLCTRIAVWFRHWTPIVLHYLGAGVQAAWRFIVAFCRAVVRHTVRITRAVVQAVITTTALIGTTIYKGVRSFVLSVSAGCRWFAGRIRHYVPIVLRAVGRALQAGARAVIAFARACLQLAEKILRATARGTLYLFAAVVAALRKLVFGVIHFLQLLGQATIAAVRSVIHAAAIAGAWLGRHAWNLSVRAGERLYQYALLMRLHRPIGILLLLWPTLWALWIAADGTPDLHILIIFVAGVVLMRSAGVIINDFADRDFDAHVSRTRDRPLASGKVTPKEALEVAALLVLGAFMLVLQLNLLTIGLSFIAVLLAAIYPFMKRYTYMPQFFLGLAFGWAVPMAFAAQTGAVPAMGWVLMLATVMWALVYDTMYAMVDREEDIELGIKSTAILFEEADRVIIGIIQLLVVLTLLLIGTRLDFNKYFYAGLAIAALLFLYQQHLIRDRVPQHCFMAFLNNNWFGAIVFGGILMNYQYG